MRRVDTRGVAETPTPKGGRTVALGAGIRVPYPEPSSESATRIGKANPRTGTKPEQQLRSALHRRGLRFRKDFPIRIGSPRPVRADIVFSRAKVAVFVDGCFWHGCPDHQRIPRANPEYWIPKLARNVQRDREVDAWLAANGWRVVRAWEHTDPAEVADTVEHLLRP